jgi:hypothetical protein
VLILRRRRTALLMCRGLAEQDLGGCRIPLPLCCSVWPRCPLPILRVRLSPSLQRQRDGLGVKQVSSAVILGNRCHFHSFLYAFVHFVAAVNTSHLAVDNFRATKSCSSLARAARWFAPLVTVHVSPCSLLIWMTWWDWEHSYGI